MTYIQMQQLLKFLKNYEQDLSYWRGIDLESVNTYTNGTPEFNNPVELTEYHQQLNRLIHQIVGD